MSQLQLELRKLVQKSKSKKNVFLENEFDENQVNLKEKVDKKEKNVLGDNVNIGNIENPQIRRNKFENDCLQEKQKFQEKEDTTDEENYEETCVTDVHKENIQRNNCEIVDKNASEEEENGGECEENCERVRENEEQVEFEENRYEEDFHNGECLEKECANETEETEEEIRGNYQENEEENRGIYQENEEDNRGIYQENEEENRRIYQENEEEIRGNYQENEEENRENYQENEEENRENYYENEENQENEESEENYEEKEFLEEENEREVSCRQERAEENEYPNYEENLENYEENMENYEENLHNYEENNESYEENNENLENYEENNRNIEKIQENLENYEENYEENNEENNENYEENNDNCEENNENYEENNDNCEENNEICEGNYQENMENYEEIMNYEDEKRYEEIYNNEENMNYYENKEEENEINENTERNFEENTARTNEENIQEENLNDEENVEFDKDLEENSTEINQNVMELNEETVKKCYEEEENENEIDLRCNEQSFLEKNGKEFFFDDKIRPKTEGEPNFLPIKKDENKDMEKYKIKSLELIEETTNILNVSLKSFIGKFQKKITEKPSFDEKTIENFRKTFGFDKVAPETIVARVFPEILVRQISQTFFIMRIEEFIKNELNISDIPKKDDGFLDINEFGYSLECLCSGSLKENQIKDIYNFLDFNKRKSISHEELKRAIRYPSALSTFFKGDIVQEEFFKEILSDEDQLTYWEFFIRVSRKYGKYFDIHRESNLMIC